MSDETEKELPKRDDKGLWLPGSSGNPAGRPKSVKALAEKAQQHTENALAVLANILLSGKDSDRIAAAKEILDRGFGKSPQSLEVSGPEGGPIETKGFIDAPPPETREQWEARIRAKHGV